MIPERTAAQVQISGAVLLPTDPREATVPGVRLTIDRRGVVAEWGEAERRVLRWDTVTGWQVDPYGSDGQSGAVITVQTDTGRLSVAAPGGDTASLHSAVDDLCRRFTRRAAAPPPTVDPWPAHAAPTVPADVELPMVLPPTPSADVTAGGEAGPDDLLGRWRPVLVALLIIVIAAAVSLVLAASAGAIHWPVLGGSGGNGGVVGG